MNSLRSGPHYQSFRARVSSSARAFRLWGTLANDRSTSGPSLMILNWSDPGKLLPYSTQILPCAEKRFSYSANNDGCLQPRPGTLLLFCDIKSLAKYVREIWKQLCEYSCFSCFVWNFTREIGTRQHSGQTLGMRKGINFTWPRAQSFCTSTRQQTYESTAGALTARRHFIKKFMFPERLCLFYNLVSGSFLRVYWWQVSCFLMVDQSNLGTPKP